MTEAVALQNAHTGGSAASSGDVKEKCGFAAPFSLRHSAGGARAACHAMAERRRVASQVLGRDAAYPFSIKKSLTAISAFALVLSNVVAQTTVQSRTEKTPVDALIPWLLQEDAQLRGIPFAEVIFDTTGKRVLAFDPKDEVDARVVKQISGVLDEAMRKLNAPDSVIQGIPRINEVSSHFEDLIRELSNKAAGFSCDFPKTAAGARQRSGYPDLELIDQESHRAYYLDTKLYAVGSRDGSFRTFYFEPKIATNKVREDAVHFIVGFEHEKSAGGPNRTGGVTWKFTRWDLVDLSHFQMKLKAEFQGSNRDMYRPEAIVASGTKQAE